MGRTYFSPVADGNAQGSNGEAPAWTVPFGRRWWALWLVFVAGATGASAQSYYYTDNFATYNSSAWVKLGNPQFTPSGLQGGNLNNGVLLANNNGGNGYRQEIRVTFPPYFNPASGWLNSVDLYLAANASLNTGYRLAFNSYYTNSLSLTVYDVQGNITLGGEIFNYDQTVSTVVRAIKQTNGILVLIGSQVRWIPTTGGYGGT